MIRAVLSSFKPPTDIIDGDLHREVEPINLRCVLDVCGVAVLWAKSESAPSLHCLEQLPSHLRRLERSTGPRPLDETGRQPIVMTGVIGSVFEAAGDHVGGVTKTRGALTALAVADAQTRLAAHRRVAFTAPTTPWVPAEVRCTSVLR